LTRFRDVSGSGRIGTSRLRPPGCGMNASQRLIDSLTYIRKFLLTFSHTWTMVAGLVTRNSQLISLHPSRSNLSSLFHVNFFAFRKLSVSFSASRGDALWLVPLCRLSGFYFRRSFSTVLFFHILPSPGNESAKISAA